MWVLGPKSLKTAVVTVIITLAASSGKCNVMVWCPSVRPFFCPLIEHAVHTRRDSQGGSTRHGQCTFRPDADILVWWLCDVSSVLHLLVAVKLSRPLHDFSGRFSARSNSEDVSHSRHARCSRYDVVSLCATVLDVESCYLLLILVRCLSVMVCRVGRSMPKCLGTRAKSYGV